MAIFHFTVKIVGRSKGKSVISASAYLNGDVMKNDETGKFSYYTGKKEVVYRQLSLCENAPPQWAEVPEENIERFQKSVRYKRAKDKEEAVEQFKLIWRKQKLWNEVLKVEKNSNAQLGRSMEISLPREWSREEQILYTDEYIQRNFVDKGMCADWAIHDKGDGNPHVHLLLTLRPFEEDHNWGNKETKDWDFVRDESGKIVNDPAHPDWWQDKKNPEHCGIRIPVMDEEGKQKVDSRNRKQWKRVLVDTTGWNNPTNCELWRSAWAKTCNQHLPPEKQVDHRSYAQQGKMEIPTIHEGAEARKIEEKYLAGKAEKGSWKVAENNIITRQNRILHSIRKMFEKASVALEKWKEWLNDFRREQGRNPHYGRNDLPNRGAGKASLRDFKGTGTDGNYGQADQRTGSRLSEMVRISLEAKQREQAFAETERGIAEAFRAIEKATDVNERFEKLLSRRAGRTAVGRNGNNAERTGRKGADYLTAADTAGRLSAIDREIKQREQSRERRSIEERLAEYKKDTERQNQGTRRGKYHDRESSL